MSDYQYWMILLAVAFITTFLVVAMCSLLDIMTSIGTLLRIKVIEAKERLKGGW